MASANDDKDKESANGPTATTTTSSNASQIPRATSSFIDNNSVCLNAPNQTNLFAPDKPDKATADAKSNSNLPGNNSYAKFDRVNILRDNFVMKSLSGGDLFCVFRNTG